MQSKFKNIAICSILLCFLFLYYRQTDPAQWSSDKYELIEIGHDNETNNEIQVHVDTVPLLPQITDKNDVMYEDINETPPNYESYYPLIKVEDLNENEKIFNSSGTDTIVFLHIQKTGGTTLGRRLVDDIDHHKCTKLERHKRKYCPRPMVRNRDRNTIQPVQPGTWIFSRYSTGWLCGLHADWTELKSCVEQKMNENYGIKKRNLIYITNLRSPVQRFLSEWKHVQRGATWRQSTLTCNQKTNSNLNTQCFKNNDNWEDVELDEFVSCDENLAYNRQTRMLADLSLVGCYENIFNLSRNGYDRLLLESAKTNLSLMRWFGLIEYQVASELLFEHVFQPLHFSTPFSKWNSTRGDEYMRKIDDNMLEKIKEGNWLDLELYQFAKKLFFQRYKQAFGQKPD